MGYTIIGVALLLFVQAKNVFPQLLLARLFFSIGGAATSTMVAAILPTMLSPLKSKERDVSDEAPPPSNGHDVSPSVSSELTITPQRLQHQTGSDKRSAEANPTRLAGIVGLFTGCGALLALGLFLRLPELIQRTDVEPGQALADSYYIVGALSLLLALVCFVGLRNLNGEDDRGWRAMWYGGEEESHLSARRRLSSFRSLVESIVLGFESPLLGLGYIGGFVARASSVGISLFIPLYVNAYYISSGICDETGHNPQDIKEHCRGAYVLAAELTGVSQLIALIFAPIFGFLADRYRRFNVPLLLAALVGAAGYIALANLDSPMASGEHGSPWIFVVMAALGISQIGAIVCSLGLLGRSVLGLDLKTASGSKKDTEPTAVQDHNSDTSAPTNSARQEHSVFAVNQHDSEESSPLLQGKPEDRSRDHLKGSIAGVYSLTGGAGILLLTKAGGVLFDKVSPASPFYMLASFNLALLAVGITVGISAAWKAK